jgi:hypothetical protein
VAAAVQMRRGFLYFLSPFSAYAARLFPTAVFWLDYREKRNRASRKTDMGLVGPLVAVRSEQRSHESVQN